jgi:hypothetical protein
LTEHPRLSAARFLQDGYLLHQITLTHEAATPLGSKLSHPDCCGMTRLLVRTTRMTALVPAFVLAFSPQLGHSQNLYLQQATEYFNDAVDAVKRRVFIPEKLGRLFVPEMLNSTREYVESIAGPPFRVSGDKVTYRVDDCEVVVRYKNQDVISIGIAKLSKKCTFDFGKYSGARFKSAESLLLGDLYSISTSSHQYRLACVFLSCGNAADPVINGYFELPRSNRFVEIQAESFGMDEIGNSRISQWEEEVIRESPKAASDEKLQNEYSCGIRGRRITPTIVGRARVNSITLGYELEADNCQI